MCGCVLKKYVLASVGINAVGLAELRLFLERSRVGMSAGGPVIIERGRTTKCAKKRVL